MKIKEDIVKLKENLEPRQLQLIAYGACALSVILVLWFAYRPLMFKLQQANQELKKLQIQLSAERNQAAILKKLDLSAKAMPADQVSRAIEEITANGRKFGLKFISITPNKLQKTAQDDFTYLPIRFTIESTYQDLGPFLAYLEQFSRCIVQVERLSVRPKDELLTELSIGTVVNLCLEAEDAK